MGEYWSSELCLSFTLDKLKPTSGFLITHVIDLEESSHPQRVGEHQSDFLLHSEFPYFPPSPAQVSSAASSVGERVGRASVVWPLCVSFPVSSEGVLGGFGAQSDWFSVLMHL